MAYFEATGKRKMLDALCRYADLINRTFGRGKRQIRGHSGHQEIELALVRLYRTTGQKRYLDLSRFFIDKRGRRPYFFKVDERAAEGEPPWRWPGPTTSLDHVQGHLPVREQTTADGHAVRAMYMFCGMAAETSDRTLEATCKRLWKNVTERRMYITGGVGSTVSGERFTTDYDLPNATAYCETCAAVGMVFWARRMLELTADVRHADVMERCLHNGVLSGVSLDGARFFYTNPLESSGPRWAETWRGTTCCPENLTRLLGSLGQYIYSQSPNELFVHLFIQSSAEIQIGGQTVCLVQKTGYPWKQDVRIEVRPSNPIRFTLAVRIPGGCRKPVLKINGRPAGASAPRRGGYARIKRLWKAGDTLDMRLPMPVERIEAHPRVSANCGRVALVRGPIVYCLEEADNGPGLNNLVLPRQSKLQTTFDPRRLGGVTIIRPRARARGRDPSGWKSDGLYRPESSWSTTTTLTAVPYYAWGNRKPGEMRVWIQSR